jgi:hypothetical protein
MILLSDGFGGNLRFGRTTERKGTPILIRLQRSLLGAGIYFGVARRGGVGPD